MHLIITVLTVYVSAAILESSARLHGVCAGESKQSQQYRTDEI